MAHPIDTLVGPYSSSAIRDRSRWLLDCHVIMTPAPLLVVCLFGSLQLTRFCDGVVCLSVLPPPQAAPPRHAQGGGAGAGDAAWAEPRV